MNFTTNETIEIERKHAPWAATTAELDDLWRKRLKAAVLGMKLNGKQLAEIQDVLTKRYKNRLKQATQTNSEDAFQVYVNAYASTYDPHTQYFSPRTSENFNINMSLSLEGIGAVLRTEDDYTEVVTSRAGGSGRQSRRAEAVGSDHRRRPGRKRQADRRGRLAPRRRRRTDPRSEGCRSFGSRSFRPPPKTANRRIVSITRNTVQLEEQSAQKKVLTLQQGGTTHKIGIIEIPTFYVDFKAVQHGDPDYKSTTRDVHALIDQLKAEGVEGIIIDLRNNGGGSLQEADSLTGLFIKSGPTVQVKTANRRANIYADTDDDIAWDGPLAVMVNRLSASASEIFAGAIQDYGRGLDHRQPDVRQRHRADADTAESRPAEDDAGQVLSCLRAEHAASGRACPTSNSPRSTTPTDRREFARRRDAVGRNQTGGLSARNADPNRVAGARRQTPRPHRQQSGLRVPARADGQEP